MNIFNRMKNVCKTKKEIEKRGKRMLNEVFKVFYGYSPSFQSFTSGIYELGLTRAIIHSIANQTSKLNPIIIGNKYKELESILQNQPNDQMTTTQFLYRVRTIYECENNVYIIPIFKDDTAMEVMGLYPISTIGSQLIREKGEIYLKYSLNGISDAIEYSKVIHLKKHYYTNEFFGESHSALYSTMELLNTQDQGIINGIEQSATIRFLVKLMGTLKPEDIEVEKERFLTNNLSSSNQSGAIFFDKKVEDITPIESKPWVIDDKQAKQIKDNVFDYFGVNETILQNNFKEDEWNSFYEGSIEPFSQQLGQALTNLLFTEDEIKKGSQILFESSRLKNASNKTKLEIITQMFDRGFITHNEGRKIFNWKPIQDKSFNGDKYYIRKEYSEVLNLDREEKEDD